MFSANSRRMLGLFAPHRSAFLWALLCLALQSLIPALLVLWLENLFNKALIARDQQMIYQVPLMLVFLYGLNGVLSYNRSVITQTISWSVITEQRRLLYAHMLYLDLGWRLQRPLGSLINHLERDCTQLQYAISALVTVIQRPLSIIGLLGVAFYLNAELTVLSLVMLPFVAIPIHFLSKRIRGRIQKELAAQSELQVCATQGLEGMSLLKAYRAEGLQHGIYEKANRSFLAAKKNSLRARFLMSPVIEIIAALSIAIVLLYGAEQVLSEDLPAGSLVAFLVSIAMLNEPIKALSEAPVLWNRALEGANRIFAVRETQAQIPETGTRELGLQPPAVSFENVSMDYGEEPVLSRFNLTIAAGETVALMGPSGVGKSSVARLLLRLFLPKDGEIRIGAHPIASYTLQSLRTRISIVFQDAYLFHCSIYENLCLDRSIDMAEVEEMCRVVGIHDYISSLEDGYQTIALEGGKRFSGGQRQRICIARALLRGSPILILDEITSSLDVEGERALIDCLRPLLADKTVLLITHRPSLCALADVVHTLHPPPRA
ncbi:MAG: ABC transporter ATP-binding protein [Myxococcota bacterium]|nr:ABC transporter ATP-binding protein [Myxococcota bacterium]